MLNGYKTYIAAAGLAAFAFYGWATHAFTADQAMVYLAQALGMAGLRHSIQKAN